MRSPALTRRRPAWFDHSEPRGLGRWLLAPLTLAGFCYGEVVSLLRATRARRAARLPCHVISVGSLCAGGAGKTPLVASLAALLHSRGRRCAVATRGYARARGNGPEGVVVASDGRGRRASPERIGDEPAWLADCLSGVPVLVSDDRARAGRYAITRFGTRVLLLDDGFQHFKLARDLDLVVVDGKAGFGNGAVLPRGPLREPLRALRFADAVVVVDGPLAPRDAAALDRWAPLAPRFAARRAVVGWRRLGEGSRVPPDSPLAPRGRVGVLSGIARPDSFRRTVLALGLEPRAEAVFPDHHRYIRRDLAALPAPPRIWVTTEKDAVKLDPRWNERVELWALAIALRFEAEEELVGWLESALRRLP